jgi:hypothetical protein
MAKSLDSQEDTMEYLLAQQKFLIQRLKDWRSPEEIVELSDLLAVIARELSR